MKLVTVFEWEGITKNGGKIVGTCCLLGVSKLQLMVAEGKLTDVVIGGYPLRPSGLWVKECPPEVDEQLHNVFEVAHIDMKRRWKDKV